MRVFIYQELCGEKKNLSLVPCPGVTKTGVLNPKKEPQIITREESYFL